MKTIRIVAAATVATALVAGCGGSNKKAAAPSTTAPPTTVAPTTTLPPPVSPLTGLHQPNAAQLRAPAVVIKIDNVDQARPQTGINQADIVYEELVEGGLTRLAAVFQSDYPTVVGPVRSGRLTDEGIIDDLNHPVFVFSGTNAVFLPILEAQPVTTATGDNEGGLFYRNDSRVAPDNLYSNVVSLAKLDHPSGPPKPLFYYVPAGGSFNGYAAGPASQMSIGFPAASVNWSYDAATHDWLRDQNGTPDVDTSGVQANAANVVVLFITYITSGVATGEGVAPAPIPEGIQTGSGVAWVLSQGKIVKGTWSRPNLTTGTSLRDRGGNPMKLTPGRTWIELVPVGTTPSVSP